MPGDHSRRIFVNLPVPDLERSKAFFSKLGFGFNSKFTDEKAACMIVNETASVMLLTQPFFKTFARLEVCDTSTQTGALFALSLNSLSEVDDMVRTAIASGGKHAMDPQDHGFMYGWSLYDPDGHHWVSFGWIRRECRSKR